MFGINIGQNRNVSYYFSSQRDILTSERIILHIGPKENTYNSLQTASLSYKTFLRTSFQVYTIEYFCVTLPLTFNSSVNTEVVIKLWKSSTIVGYCIPDKGTKYLSSEECNQLVRKQ